MSSPQRPRKQLQWDGQNNKQKREREKQFGKNREKQKLKKKLLGIVGQLKDALVEAIKKVADLEINHQKTLLSLSKKRNPPDIILNGEVIKGIPLLTEEEYQIALLNP